MRLFASALLCLALAAPALAQKRPTAKKPASAPKSGPDLPSKLPLTAPAVVVDGQKIPMSAYVDRLSLRFGPEVRESLVMDVLVRQEAARRKLTASPQEIAAVIERAYGAAVRQYGGEKELTAALQNTRGWTPADFKIMLRDGADLQVLREKIGASLAKPESIKESDIEARYNAQRLAFTQPGAVEVSHIVVLRPSNGDPEKEKAARAKADALLKKIQGGASFEQVAKSSSEDAATAAKGGKIPVKIVQGASPFGAAFEAIAYSAPQGLINEVIPAPDGYHVFRIDSHTEGRVVPLSEVKEQIRAALLNEQRDQKLDNLFQGLRGKANIETGKF